MSWSGDKVSIAGGWCDSGWAERDVPAAVDSVLFPFQRDGVRQLLAMLDRQGGALLADDVGLGKSVQAMAVAVSLGRPIALVTPAALRAQWEDILAGGGPLGALGLDATIVTHAALSRGAVRNVARGALLIVDEAHQFRTRATKRYKALRELCISRPVLLLSATPVHNSMEDIRSLLSLFLPEDRRLQGGAQGLGVLATAFGRAVVRRSRASVRVDRVTSVIDMPNYGEARVAQLQLAAELAMGEGEPVALCLRVLLARAASSTAALDDTLARLCAYLRRAIEAAGAGQKLGRAEFLRLFGDDPEVQCAQQVFPFLYGMGDCDVAPDAEELTLRLRALSSIGQRLRSAEPMEDPRLSAVRERRGSAVLAFSRYRRTAESFSRSAARAGLRTSLWHGGGAWLGGTRVSPTELLDRFRTESSDGALLVATEVASQGLDLPFVDCILHLDLPWSPATILQRNGRADRLQRAGGFEVIVCNPPPDIESTLLGRRAIARKSALQSVLFASECSLASTVQAARLSIPSLELGATDGVYWSPGNERWLVRISDEVHMYSIGEHTQSGGQREPFRFGDGVSLLASVAGRRWERLPDGLWRGLHLVHLVLGGRRSASSPYLDDAMASWLQATCPRERSGWLQLLAAPLPVGAEQARDRWVQTEARFVRSVVESRLPGWTRHVDRGWSGDGSGVKRDDAVACRYLFVGGDSPDWLEPWVNRVTAAYL